MDDMICRLKPRRSGQLTTFDYETGIKTAYIKPSERKTVIDYKGCGVITRLWMTIPGWFWQHWNTGFPIDQTILKKFIIRIYWDDSVFPSVEAPIGDLFGIGHCEQKHFTSRYFGMSSGGFYLYYPMPFQKRVKIEVENLHESMAVDLFLNANYDIYDELPADFSYFHAFYNFGDRKEREPVDIIDTNGSGQFVGCALSMQGEKPMSIYFLEAPEFMFVDGDEKPAICGTGLEDYFNGAWYFREGEFASDYFGCPIKDTMNSMVSMYRIHDQDAVRFNQSFKMYFKTYAPDNLLTNYKYCSTAYYYMDKPTRLQKDFDKQNLGIMYRFRNTDHISIP